MVGLVVGLLVRHLEDAGKLLDPYFTEPLIWEYEFARVVSEQSLLAANSEGIKAPQRRQWSLREAAMVLALGARGERAVELRVLGETLIERARRSVEEGRDAGATEEEGIGGEEMERRLAPVKAWASSLDPQ